MFSIASPVNCSELQNKKPITLELVEFVQNKYKQNLTFTNFEIDLFLLFWKTFVKSQIFFFLKICSSGGKQTIPTKFQQLLLSKIAILEFPFLNIFSIYLKFI